MLGRSCAEQEELSMRSLLLLAAVVLGACGGGAAHAPAANYEGPIRSADTAHGDQVFNTVCMACHSGSPLNNVHLTAARVREQVRQGRGRMPAIPATRVSDDDLEAVLAYLTTIGAVTDPLPGGAAPAGGGAEPTTGGEGTTTTGSGT